MKKSLFSALIAIVALVFAGCEPKVQPVDYTVKLSATELTLENGASQKLTAGVVPAAEGVTHQLVWTSSDEAVATVNASGIVEAVGLGTATITVSVNAPEGSIDTYTPATCVVNVTNDAVLNTFVLGGSGLFDLGDPIPGTDTTLTISVGEVNCSLAPSLYYVWNDGIVLVNNKLTGAGYIMPLETYTYVITDGPYAGYYISDDLFVDTIAADAKVGYTAHAGQLLDVEMYGDAWDGLFTLTEDATEEEYNAVMDKYYGSQTGTPIFQIDFNTGTQSYYWGNVSNLIFVEDLDGSIYYDLKIEWYDHVNAGRWYGLLAETELNEEDGLEYIIGIQKPYDMRVIHKQYQQLPPAEDEETEEVKAAQIKKPVRLNATQANLLKSTVRTMYKK